MDTNTTEPIRVVLAEDHTLVRAGLQALLQNHSEIQVIAAVDNGRDALRMIEVHRPDVVLMDIGMPQLNGLEVTARVTQQLPDVHVIILSMHADEEYVLHALRSGAVGYLLKDSGTSELELAIKAGARGEAYLSPPVSKHVVTDYVRLAGEQANGRERLTPRQREILQLIAEGCRTGEIAQRLSISIKTVEAHRVQLMERLEIFDVAGLVRYAIRTGLVASDK